MSGTGTSISGLQRAQAANARLSARVQPTSAPGRAVALMLAMAERSAIAHTDVDTGALRGSHRIRRAGARGYVFLDQSAANPRTRQRTSVYGVYEHRRGGRHAFYQLTAEQDGPAISRAGGDLLLREIREAAS